MAVTDDYRGFYGCAVAGDSRIVRVDWDGPTPRFGPPKPQTVDCPVCKETHKVEVMWRKKGTSEAEADIVLG